MRTSRRVRTSNAEVSCSSSVGSQASRRALGWPRAWRPHASVRRAVVVSVELGVQAGANVVHGAAGAMKSMYLP